MYRDDLRIAATRSRKVGQPRRIPRSIARHLGPRARQKTRHRVLRQPRRAKPPSGRRLIQRDAKRHIAPRGHSRRCAKAFGDLPRQPVRAPMSAKQRHHDRAVVRDRDHRRLRPLVRQQWGDRADQDTTGADPDHGTARREHLAREIQRVGKDLVRARNPPLATEHRHVEGIRHPARDLRPRSRDRHHHRFHSHGSSPLFIRIIEKYGAVSGACAKGQTTSSGRPTRAT